MPLRKSDTRNSPELPLGLPGSADTPRKHALVVLAEAKISIPSPRHLLVKKPKPLSCTDAMSEQELVSFTAVQTFGAIWSRWSSSKKTYKYIKPGFDPNLLPTNIYAMLEIYGGLLRQRAIPPFAWTLFRLHTIHEFAGNRGEPHLTHVMSGDSISSHEYRHVYRNSSFATLGGNVFFAPLGRSYFAAWLRFMQNVEASPRTVHHRATHFLNEHTADYEQALEQAKHEQNRLFELCVQGKDIWHEH